MAKPGSDQARNLAGMARQAADLDALRALPDSVRAEVQRETERRLGLRCLRCDSRIDGEGVKARQIQVAMQQGQPAAGVAEAHFCVPCWTEDEDARAGATCSTRFTVEWHDDGGAPPELGDEGAEVVPDAEPAAAAAADAES